MKTLNLARNITRSIMLVIASLLLISLRLVMVALAWPPYKVLEKTNRVFTVLMVEVHNLLSF